MPISVTGVESTLKALKGMAKKDAIKISDGLRKCADIVFKESQRLVPVENGTLKASGKVSVSGVGFGAVAKVSYDTDYAIFVHENLEAYHTPPTQSRYLAAACHKCKKRMEKALERQIKASTS